MNSNYLIYRTPHNSYIHFGRIDDIRYFHDIYFFTSFFSSLSSRAASTGTKLYWLQKSSS